MEHKSLLIAKLDKVMSELAELRELLANDAPTDMGESHPSVGTPEVETSKGAEEETASESCSIFDLGRDADLIFDSSEDQDIDDFLQLLQDKREEVEEPEEPKQEEKQTSVGDNELGSSETEEHTSEQLLLDSFIERGSAEEMRQTFEERVKFELIPHLSLADNYLFANELFMGNQAELKNVLSDLELMSSMSQAEDYLYNRLGLNPEHEEVQRFIDFIRGHAERI
ncbi:MAG: hypothetical protein Q4D93_05380 [Porphyromonas sp.]|nr:hypothetical protein [Porphyromonas sp.]